MGHNHIINGYGLKGNSLCTLVSLHKLLVHFPYFWFSEVKPKHEFRLSLRIPAVFLLSWLHFNKVSGIVITFLTSGPKLRPILYAVSGEFCQFVAMFESLVEHIKSAYEIPQCTMQHVKCPFMYADVHFTQRIIIDN